MEEVLKLYQELRSLFDGIDLVADFCQQIHHIVQEKIDQIPDGTRLAIRPAGGDTEMLLKLYDFSKKNIVGIVSPSDHGDDFCGYPCFTTDSFSAISCDCIIVSSFYHHQKIKEELEMLHVPYIDFYDELERQGIQLPLPYLSYETYPQLVVNYFYLCYLEAEAETQRETTLRKLLQVAVEYKDFPLISKLYQDCGGEEGEFPLLKIVWKKSELLLNCIQNKIQERKQKDIIMFWTDAVSYYALHCLPETMELSKQGTFFQRAYTHTPYTEATMFTLFCNMLPIDDFPQSQEKVDSHNSPLLQYMENEGYKVRVIGSSALSMGKEHLIEARPHQPCNVKWWEGVLDLLQSSEPCFFIFHFMESHYPLFVPNLKEPVNLFMASIEQREAQIKAALEYLDNCLLFYHKTFGNTIQVFFSDHGLHLWEDTNWSEQLLHTYFFALGETIPKKTVTRFFPYRNFDKFVRWLVDPARFSLDDVCTDEVIFQDIDFYNPMLIYRYIKEDNTKKGLAYRGIINYESKYLLNPLGEELFYQMQQDGSEKLVPLENPVLRDELRSKAGTGFLDIYQYDKFRYTRKLYDYINSKKE